MKKLIVFIILITICLCIVLSGCKDTSFETVAYVKLDSGGNSYTFKSIAKLTYGNNLGNTESATESEYKKADVRYHINSGTYFSSIDLTEYHTVNSYYGLTEEDIGQYVYWRGNYNPFTGVYSDYYKHKFKGWDYIYVHVKKVNDNKLVVYTDGNFDVNKSNSEHATTYEVTSYSIGNKLF